MVKVGSAFTARTPVVAAAPVVSPESAPVDEVNVVIVVVAESSSEGGG